MPLHDTLHRSLPDIHVGWNTVAYGQTPLLP
jgi:hypothetical protein